MMPMDRFSAQTGHLFGEGMDRPPPPPIPNHQQVTMADLRRMNLQPEEVATNAIRQSKARARTTDPITSHEAADAATPVVGAREMVVLKALGHRGASTWDELSSFTGLRPGTISPRFKPLREKGLIYDTGEQAPGVSGAMQIVWGLTPAGRALVAAPDPKQLDLMEGA